jgi:hypothetical protein
MNIARLPNWVSGSRERLAGQDGALPVEVAHQALVGAGAEELPGQDDRGDHDDQPRELLIRATLGGVQVRRRHHRGGDRGVLRQRPAFGRLGHRGAEQHHDADGQHPAQHAAVAFGQAAEDHRPAQHQQRGEDHDVVHNPTRAIHGLAGPTHDSPPRLPSVAATAT